MPAIACAGDDNEYGSADGVLLQLDAEEYVPYSDYAFDDDDEEEEDEDLPDNEFQTRYENGRMAFLFGQFEIAYKAWWPLAHDGFAKAQAALAWMYHTGNGVKKNAPEAVKWYFKAATQGHVIAQNNFAVMHENGLGVLIDKKVAAKWYRAAADAGYANAQYNLGRLYERGHGVQKDTNEAKYWYRIASRQGVEMATTALAVLEKIPAPKASKPKTPQVVAHAPYHGNPVEKGLSWIKQQKKNHYTIQLARSQDEDWIIKLAASHQLPHPLVKFKSKDAKGKEWHNLIYGSFLNWQEAETVRKSLPKSLHKWSPWLRRFGEVNQILLD